MSIVSLGASRSSTAITTRFGDVSVEIAEGEFPLSARSLGLRQDDPPRVIAGFEEVESGAVRIAGADIEGGPGEPATDQHGVPVLTRSFRHLSVLA